MKPMIGGFEHDGIASISEKKSGSFEAGCDQLIRSKAQDNLSPYSMPERTVLLAASFALFLTALDCHAEIPCPAVCARDASSAEE
jgi:hypothetical protein